MNKLNADRRITYPDQAFLSKVALIGLLVLLCGCVPTPQVNNRLSEMRQISTPYGWKIAAVINLEYKTDLVFEVGEQGNLVRETETKWMKVNDVFHEGIRYVSIPEHKVVEQPVKIMATAYYPDGSRWELSKDRITQYEEDFSDVVENVFYIPKYQKDMLVKLQVERVYHKPEYTGRYLFRDRFPILKRIVNLRYPDDVDLEYGVENGNDSQFEESFIVENGVKRENVTVSSLINFRETDRTPYPEAFYEGFYVSFPPKGKKSFTWRELGDHYLEQSAEVFAGSTGIKPLAEAIPADLSRDMQVAKGFDIIVGKIRYHGDWRGRHAFIPREAGVVLKNGYGDCKELSVILKSVLDEKRVVSYPALLSVWGHFQPLEKYPMLGGFNHMILAIPDTESGYRYVDPTHSWADADNSYYDSIGRNVLVIKPADSKFMTISAGTDFENEIVTDSHIRVDEDGEWLIEGKIDLLGYPALRFFETLQESNRKDPDSQALKSLEENFGILARSVDVPVATEKNVQIKYSAEIDENYVSLGRGGIRLTIPSLFRQEVNYQLTDKLGEIHMRKFIQKDRWTVPFGVKSSELPSHNSVIAISKWHVDRNSIERRYSQYETRRNSRDGLLEEWDNYLDRLVNGVVWR